MSSFDPSLEIGKYSYVMNKFLPSVLPIQICTANPNRVTLIVANNLNKFLGLTLNTELAIQTNPSFIIQNGDNLILDWETYGAAVTLPWLCGQSQYTNNSVTTNGTYFYVTEVIYQPKRI